MQAVAFTEPERRGLTAGRRARYGRISGVAVIATALALVLPLVHGAAVERGVAGHVRAHDARPHIDGQNATTTRRLDAGSSGVPFVKRMGGSALTTSSTPVLKGRLALGGSSGIDVYDLGADRFTHVADPDATDAAWSKDGSTLAYTTWNWSVAARIETVRSDGTGHRIVVSMDGKRKILTWPTWSPDGKRLAFVEDSSVIVTGTAHALLQLWMVNADGTGLHQVRTPTGDFPDEPRWSPDGHFIAYSNVTPGPITVGHQSTIKILDLAKGTATTVGPGAQSAWSPDGRKLAVVATDGGIDLIDVRTHARRRLDVGPGAQLQDYDDTPTISPDGRWVAFSRVDPGLPSTSGQQSHVFVVPTDGSKRAATLGLVAYQVAWGPAS